MRTPSGPFPADYGHDRGCRDSQCMREMGRRQPPLDRGAQRETRYEVPTPWQRILYVDYWQRTRQPPEPKTFRENRDELASGWVVDTKLELYSRGHRRKTASPSHLKETTFRFEGHLGPMLVRLPLSSGG